MPDKASIKQSNPRTGRNVSRDISHNKAPTTSVTDRRISELVLAEMFFVQATIESATALGDGFDALLRRFSANDGDSAPEDLGELLRRTGRDVVEPYAERIEDFRKLFSEDRAA